jgi:FixJ family two-component response regulator
MSATATTVYIVDDDVSVRRALARLVQSAGMRAEVFATVPDLVSRASRAEPTCVIADIGIPDISGLDLPGLLARSGHRLPVIFVTA